MRIIETDALVIGAGLSGLTYALKMSQQGHSVCVLSAGAPLQCNSDLAQGGIIFDRDGSPDDLVRDILEAGGGFGSAEAARALARDGVSAVEEVLIKRAAVSFDRHGSDYHFTKEGGHRSRRIIHAKDQTGHAIMERMTAEIHRDQRVTTLYNHIAVDLLTLSHHGTEPRHRYAPLTCYGAYVLNASTGEVLAVTARRTVVAAGGLGDIFLHTSNQSGQVGHGLAMAFRAGARVIDLEFIQFHPTTFYLPGARRWLISEAVRGEGAVLVNKRGEAFMDDVHPMKSLAPRDVVSQAIHREMVRSGEPCVFLDTTRLPQGMMEEHFPAIHRYCLDHGVDPTRERVPVVPAAHYTCGGIFADLNGQTSILNLSAIGESACTGLHGANRLASTSLLECLTSACAAASFDGKSVAGGAHSVLPKPPAWSPASGVADPVLIQQDLATLRQTMWNYAGIVRSPKRLKRAKEILDALHAQVNDFYRECEVTRDLVELRNAVQAGLLVVHAAALNPVSAGAHHIEVD